MHVLVFLTEYGGNRNQTREASPVVMIERWEGKAWGAGGSWCSLFCEIEGKTWRRKWVEERGRSGKTKGGLSS